MSMINLLGDYDTSSIISRMDTAVEACKVCCCLCMMGYVRNTTINENSNVQYVSQFKKKN